MSKGKAVNVTSRRSSNMFMSVTKQSGHGSHTSNSMHDGDVTPGLHPGPCTLSGPFESLLLPDVLRLVYPDMRVKNRPSRGAHRE